MAKVFRHTREKVVKKIKLKQTIASIKNWHHSLYYIGKKTDRKLVFSAIFVSSVVFR